jgi:hypothetical protein
MHRVPTVIKEKQRRFALRRGSRFEEALREGRPTPDEDDWLRDLDQVDSQPLCRRRR